jgi:hypothetical protein
MDSLAIGSAAQADEHAAGRLGPPHGITLPNAASLSLHRRFGFEPVGVFHAVGYKFGRCWDVQWLEKALR